MIIRMYMTLVFNKKLKKEAIHLSPGGYELVTDRQKVLTFDFEDSYGNLDDEATSVHFEVEHLDQESFPGATTITSEDLKHVVKIEEFYVDIENVDSEGRCINNTDQAIALTSIQNVEIEYDHGDDIEKIAIPGHLFTPELIHEINQANNIQTQ